VNNEHQSYLEGWLLGLLLNAFPKAGLHLVKRYYAKAYSKAVYCDQVCMEPILKDLMAQGLPRFFKTRYMVAGYDMYLRNSHQAPPAGIHVDLPNFHHFYETENDLSLYIPLVDLDETNGGRIRVLPEQKLKAPGNVLLKMLYEHFSRDPESLDESGYVDPNRIGPEKLRTFIQSKAHQELMRLYKSVNALAKGQYAEEFQTTLETAGRVLIFNNKNFHAAEQWKNRHTDREIYVIRMFPLYDVKIRLKRTLHGVPINNYLLDMKTGEVRRFSEEVDVRRIPAEDKVTL
jgi:ectoine hydroxylase-related dioxygenase (phytanoyl-CoA dioxygenase family)